MVGIPRSKGCATCRRRKVACDQEKPYCRNCREGGRACEGYARHPTIIQWSTNGPKKRQRFEEVARVSPSHQFPYRLADDASSSGKGSRRSNGEKLEWKLVSFSDAGTENVDCRRYGDSDAVSDDKRRKSHSQMSLLKPPASELFESPHEQRAFDFFVSRTSLQISGSFPCDFWNKVVIQIASVDAGVRHALVALASIHEKYECKGQSAENDNQFALRQYERAIHDHRTNLTALNNPENRENADIHYASSMVFICVEMLQGHYSSAMSLAQGAVRLFYARPLGLHQASASSSKLFDSLFGRLQAQSVGLVGRAAVGDTVPPQNHPCEESTFPERFRSLAEARSHLDFFLNSRTLLPAYEGPLSPVCENDPALVDDERQTRQQRQCRSYVSGMERWSMAFQRLLPTLDADAMTDLKHHALLMLKIRHAMGLTILRAARAHSYEPNDEMLWDSYMAVWEEVIALAASVVEGQRSASPSRTQLFTLDSTLVAPLYELGRYCRDPVLRRKAIALLRAVPVREGMWDSTLAAYAVERQMHIEEGACSGEVKTAADIPSEARITDVLPTFEADRREAQIAFLAAAPESRRGSVSKKTYAHDVVTLDGL